MPFFKQKRKKTSSHRHAEAIQWCGVANPQPNSFSGGAANKIRKSKFVCMFAPPGQHQLDQKSKSLRHDVPDKAYYHKNQSQDKAGLWLCLHCNMSCGGQFFKGCWEQNKEIKICVLAHAGAHQISRESTRRREEARVSDRQQPRGRHTCNMSHMCVFCVCVLCAHMCMLLVIFCVFCVCMLLVSLNRHTTVFLMFWGRCHRCEHFSTRCRAFIISLHVGKMGGRHIFPWPACTMSHMARCSSALRCRMSAYSPEGLAVPPLARS